MNSFITKTAMLVLFLLAVTCAWAAVTMVFQVSLFNILLGILAAFFLLRAFELADKVNKLGPYAEEDEAPVKPKPMGPNKPGPRFGEGAPDDEVSGDENPDEE
jgi:hypothetical protein